MASPVQGPPVRRQRSFAGPVVLIVIGILLFLANMGTLRWAVLGHWFASYWPALIILWGIVKLVEYQRAQRSGARASGIGVGGVFLLLMLIVFGLAATQAQRFNWQELRDQIDIDDSDFPLFGHSYSYDDQLQQAFTAGSSVHVNNERGAVNISTSDDNQMVVRVHKRINADNKDEADKWNAGTRPQINVSGSIITLNANNKGAGDHWVAADLDISLPRKAPVVISSGHGDVSVLGREGDVDITNDHADVTASDIKGKVSLNLDHSSARISQVSGDVTVEGHSNDISLEDVKGAAHLNGEFMESVKLSRIAQGITFKSSRTDMEFSRLDGSLDLDSGDLQASDINGPVRLTTRSKDIRLTGVSGDLRLEDENGSVEVRMNKLGSVQVQNRQGDVQIYVPDKSGFQLDARARGGEIESDFNELKIDNSDEQATAVGTVAGGGPRVVVNNEHGTIELRRRSSIAELPAPPSPPSAKTPRTPPSPKSPTVTEN